VQSAAMGQIPRSTERILVFIIRLRKTNSVTELNCSVNSSKTFSLATHAGFVLGCVQKPKRPLE